MKTVKARMLKPHEGLKLHRMKRQLTNQVNHRHARIVLLSRGGLSNAQIAQQCDCTATWVRQILHRFNAGGIEAITWYPYYCSATGPRKFMAEVARADRRSGLVAAQEADRHDRLVAGEAAANTCKSRRSSARFPWNGCGRLLRRRRIHWRHTKTWKDSNDPQFWAKYRRIRRLYRQPAPGRPTALRR